MQQSTATVAMADNADDPELRLDRAATDLHSLRATHPELDHLSARLQLAAATRAVERLRQYDAARAEILGGQRILVTGSAGYLGATLCTALKSLGADVVGLDIVAGATVDVQADLADPTAVLTAAAGCNAVMNTAARHAPHATHVHEAGFISTNIDGTQNILDAAAAAGACVVHSSTTSLTISERVRSLEAAGSLVWLDESAQPPQTPAGSSADPLDAPRNKYGRTKLEAERRCVAAAASGQPVVVLRVSRFYPEDVLPSPSDSEPGKAPVSNANLKANELLGRRVALGDVVDGHLRALTRLLGREPELSGQVLTLSAPWPWTRAATPTSAAEFSGFLERERPELAALYSELGWSMTPIGRVYDSSRAVQVLEWRPVVTFDAALSALARGDGADGELSAEDVNAGRF